MRILHAGWLAGLLITGCGSSATDHAADLAAAGDLAVSDGGAADLAAADAPPGDLATPPGKDGAAPSCAPSGGCLYGPACGDGCCGEGERCDTAGIGPVCRCGQNPSCANGEHCAAPGPQGGATCGVTCCGGNGGPPCPL